MNEDIISKIKHFRVEFGPSRKDILSFTNQLAVMVRAGISIQDTLESIASQIENKKFAAVIMDLKQRIESGESLSQALGAHPEVFNNLYVNMVAAAEISGSLSKMLDKLAEYLDQENETRSQVKGAMVYPIIIAVMAVSVTIFLLCFVLPRFVKVFEGHEDLLPTPTKILIASSVFLRNFWFLVIPAIGAAVGGFLFFINTKEGRNWWDKMKLKITVIKTLHNKVSAHNGSSHERGRTHSRYNFDYCSYFGQFTIQKYVAGRTERCQTREKNRIESRQIQSYAC
jgi:type IV pilus assembly protein PilC